MMATPPLILSLPRERLLTVQQQRFCPLCDRSFLEGEAVLRCEGCGVMHHPGCWVTNAGCATPTEHKMTPIAQAYSSSRPVGAEAPHPGEGTRVAASVRQAPPIATTRPVPPLESQPAPPLAADEPMIGGANWPASGQPPPRTVHRSLPLDTTGPPVPPRRYIPPTDTHARTRPMPRIYGGNPLIRYWYVPAAVVLAVVVAFAVIWVGGLIGGDDSNAASTQTPAANAQTTASTGQTAPAGASPAASTTPATGAGKFAAGDVVVVTGSEGCLNVRVAPGTGPGSDIIVCLSDGEQLTVSGGPQVVGGLTWWKVKTGSSEGWAAEDYLTRKP